MPGLQISPVSGLVDEESVRNILQSAFSSQGLSGTVHVSPSRYYGPEGWSEEEGMWSVSVSSAGVGDDLWSGTVKGGPNQTLMVRSGIGWDLVRGETLPVTEKGLQWSPDVGISPYITGIQKWARHVTTALYDKSVQEQMGLEGWRKNTVNELYRQSRVGEIGSTATGVEGRAFPKGGLIEPPFAEGTRLTGGYTYISPNESPEMIRYWSNILTMPILGGMLDPNRIEESVSAYEQQVSSLGRAEGSVFGALRGSAVWRPDKNLANVILRSAAGTIYGEEGQVSPLTEKFIKRSYSAGRRPVGVPTVVTRGTMETVPEELLAEAGGVLRGDLTSQMGIRTQAFTSLGALPWQSGQMRVQLPQEIEEFATSRGGMIESAYSAKEQVPIAGIRGPEHLRKGALSLRTDWLMGEGQAGKRLQPGVQYQIGTFGQKTLDTGKVTPGPLTFSVSQPGAIEAFDLILPAAWGAGSPQMEQELEPYLREYREAGIRNIFFTGQDETPYINVRMQKTGLVGWKAAGAKGQQDVPIMGAPEAFPGQQGLPLDASRGFHVQEAKDLGAVAYNALQAMPMEGPEGVWKFLNTLYRGRGQRQFLKGYENVWRGEGKPTLNYQYVAQGLGMETGEQLVWDIARRAFQQEEAPGGGLQAVPWERMDQRFNQLMGKFGWGRVRGQTPVGQYTPETRDYYWQQVRIALEKGSADAPPMAPDKIDQAIKDMQDYEWYDKEGTGLYTLYTDPNQEWLMHPKLANMVYELGGVASDQGNIARALGAQNLGPMLQWFEKHQDRLFTTTPAQTALKDILMAQLNTAERRLPREFAPLVVSGEARPGGGAIHPQELGTMWSETITGDMSDLEKMEKLDEVIRQLAEARGFEVPEEGANLYFKTLGATLAKPQSFRGIEAAMYEMRPAPGSSGEESWLELGMETATKSTTKALGIISKLLQAEAHGGTGGPEARQMLSEFYESYAYSDQLKKRTAGIFTHFGGTGLVRPGDVFISRRGEERLFHTMGGRGPTGREWRWVKDEQGKRTRQFTEWGEFRRRLAGVDNMPPTFAVGTRPPYVNIGTAETPGSYQALRIRTELNDPIMRRAMRAFAKRGIQPAEVFTHQGYIANLGDLDIDPFMLIPMMYKKQGRRGWESFRPGEETAFLRQIFEAGTPEAQARTMETIFGEMSKHYDPFSSQLANYVREIGGEKAYDLLTQSIAEDMDIGPGVHSYNIQKQRQMGRTYNTYVRRFRVEAGLLGLPEDLVTEMGDSLSKYYQFAVDMESDPTAFEEYASTAGFYGRAGGGLAFGARLKESFRNIGESWNPLTPLDKGASTRDLVYNVAYRTAMQQGHVKYGADTTTSGRAMASLFGVYQGLEPAEQRQRWLDIAQEWEEGMAGADPNNRGAMASQLINRFIDEGKFGFYSPGVQGIMSRVMEFHTDPNKPERMDAIRQAEQLGQMFTWGEVGSPEKISFQEMLMRKAPAIGAYQFAKSKTASDRQDFARDPWTMLHAFISAKESGIVAESSAIQDWWRVLGTALGMPNPADDVSYTDPLGRTTVLQSHEDIEELRTLFQQMTAMDIMGTESGQTLARYEPSMYLPNVEAGMQPRKYHMTEVAHVGAILEGRPSSFSRNVEQGIVGRILGQAIPELSPLKYGMERQTRQMMEGNIIESGPGRRLGATSAGLPRAEGMGIYAGGNLLFGMPDVFRAWRDPQTGLAHGEIGDIKRNQPAEDLAYQKQVQGYIEMLKYAEKYQGGQVYRHQLPRGDQSAFDRWVQRYKQGGIDEADLKLEQVPIETYLRDVTRMSDKGLDIDLFMEALREDRLEGALYYSQMATPGDVTTVTGFRRKAVDPSVAYQNDIATEIEKVTGHIGGKWNVIGEQLIRRAGAEPGTLKQGFAQKILGAQDAIRRLFGQFPAVGRSGDSLGMPAPLPRGFGMGETGTVARTPYDISSTPASVLAKVVSGFAEEQGEPLPAVTREGGQTQVTFAGRGGDEEEFLRLYDAGGTMTGLLGMESTLGRNVIDAMGGIGGGGRRRGGGVVGAQEVEWHQGGWTGEGEMPLSYLQQVAAVLGKLESVGEARFKQFMTGGYKSGDVLGASAKLVMPLIEELLGRREGQEMVGGTLPNLARNMKATLRAAGAIPRGDEGWEELGDDWERIKGIIETEEDPVELYSQLRDVTGLQGVSMGKVIGTSPMWKRVKRQFKRLRAFAPLLGRNYQDIPGPERERLGAAGQELGEGDMPTWLHAMAGTPGEVGEEEFYESTRHVMGQTEVLVKDIETTRPSGGEIQIPERYRTGMTEAFVSGLESGELVDKQIAALKKWKGAIIDVSTEIEKASEGHDKYSQKVVETGRKLQAATAEREAMGARAADILGLTTGARGQKLPKEELALAYAEALGLEEGAPNLKAIEDYQKALEKERAADVRFTQVVRGEDPETANYSSLMRRALGGFGLMYMRSIAGIMAQPAMFGYTAAEQQTQQIMQGMAPFVGGFVPQRTQEIAMQNAMAAYGGGGWMGMRQAYANLLMNQPGAGTLQTALTAGVGAMGATATMGLWTGSKALGEMSVLGPVGLFGVLAGLGMSAYGANVDVQGSTMSLVDLMAQGRARLVPEEERQGGGLLSLIPGIPGYKRPVFPIQTSNILDAFASGAMGVNIAAALGYPERGPFAKWTERAREIEDRGPILEALRAAQAEGKSFEEFFASRPEISQTERQYYQEMYLQYMPRAREEYKTVPVTGLTQAKMLQEFLGIEIPEGEPFARFAWSIAQGVDVAGAAGAVAQGAGGTLEEQRQLMGQIIQQLYGEGGEGLTLELAEEMKLGGTRLGQIGERAGRRLGGLPIERSERYAQLTTPEWEDYLRRVTMLESQWQTMGVDYIMPQPEEYMGMTDEQIQQRMQQDMYLQRLIQGRQTVQAGFAQFGMAPDMGRYAGMGPIELSQLATQQQFGAGWAQQMLVGGFGAERANLIGGAISMMQAPDYQRYRDMVSGNQFQIANWAIQNMGQFGFARATGGLTGIGGQEITPGAIMQVDIAEVGGQPIGLTGSAWGTTGFGNFNQGIWQSSAGFVDQIMGGMGGVAPEGFRTAAIGGQFGINMWQLQRQREYQQATSGIQMAQIALQERYQPMFWDIQDRLRDAQRGQAQWQLGFQERQMESQAGFWMQNFGLNLRQQEMQRGWAREDWAFQDQTRAMQWGWRVEDFEEQRRFMTGRDRRLAERQMARETIMHDLEGEQIDKQRQRQQETWALEDERMLLQLQQQQTALEFQEEQLERTREYYEETWALQDEQTELSREYWREQIELQKQSAGAAAQYAQDMQFVAEFMEKTRQEAQRIADEKNLLNVDFWTEFGEKLVEIDPIFNSALVEATGTLSENLSLTQPLYGEFVEDVQLLGIALGEVNPLLEEMIESWLSLVEERPRKNGTPKQGKQFGGTVIGGEEYLMGEGGPEVYRPYASGVVTPNYKTDPWQNQTWVMDWTPTQEKNVTIIVKIGEEEIKHKVIEFVSQEIE